MQNVLAKQENEKRGVKEMEDHGDMGRSAEREVPMQILELRKSAGSPRWI